MSESYTHGTNPLFLIDKIVRTKIYACPFYKEKCFALDAKTLVDRAVELHSIGGTFGSTKKPTPFLCLLLKLLQISPEKEIIQKYIESDFKYLRALACFYVRLTAKPAEVYLNLEPVLNDYRKIKLRSPEGDFRKSFMDEMADELLNKEVYLEIVLPKLPKRFVLEENENLPIRVSVLEPELKFEDEKDDEDKFSNVTGLSKVKKKAKLGTGGMNPQKEPAPETDEYWLELRKRLGLAPPKPKIEKGIP
jgi:pre-mRNA-splicing factor 38A